MAQGRRVERVAALLRREVSELLVHGIKDERVHHGMVSVTGVEVAGDLPTLRVPVGRGLVGACAALFFFLLSTAAECVELMNVAYAHLAVIVALCALPRARGT